MNELGSPSVISATSILSLFAVVVLLATAYLLSLRLLPRSSSQKIRVLFVWHLFDALIHFFFEGSYLYHCFFTYTQLPAHHSANISGQYNGGNYLGHDDRLYGAIHGNSPTAKLWQEYALADRRWGGADLTVISLEVLTVFGAGPLALWVCDMLRRGDSRVWFWAIVLATGELYGGFMTFAPEWLSGSPSLNTSTFMYKWVYLFFFNTLWVWFPFWVLVEAYRNIDLALRRGGRGSDGSRKKVS